MGSGIALPPSLWERIDAVAEAQGRSRSEVIREVLGLHVPVVFGSQKMGGSIQEMITFTSAEGAN